MRIAAPLLVAMLCAASAGGALADDRRDDHPRREAQGHHAQPPGRSDRIAREAQRQTGGGRVLSVQPAEGGHKVKVLKDGEVHVLTVPERDQDNQ